MNDKPAMWSPEGHKPPVAAAKNDYPWKDWPGVGDIVLTVIDTDGPPLPAAVQKVDDPPEDEYGMFGPLLSLYVMTFTGYELLAGVRYGYERGYWHWTEKAEKSMKQSGWRG